LSPAPKGADGKGKGKGKGKVKGKGGKLSQPRPASSNSRKGGKGGAASSDDEDFDAPPRRGILPGKGKARSSSLPGRRPQAGGKGKPIATRPSSLPPRRPSLKVELSWDHPEALPLEEISEGSVVNGVVVNAVPFGVFVDIGAEQNALLGIPARYWKKFARGDLLDGCTVQSVDLEKRRLLVAVQDAQEALDVNRTPLEDLTLGMYLEGVVDHKNRYGVWVNVFAEVCGRLNVPRRYSTKLLSGQVVKNIVIESVDLENRRLGLTLDDPEATVADQLVLVGMPPLQLGGKRPRRKVAPAAVKSETLAPVKAKAKAKARVLRSVPPAAPVAPQAGDWVNGLVTSIATRGVMVDIGMEKVATLVVSADLKAQMQKGDQVQGMKVERVFKNGAVTLSMEDPMLEINDPGAEAKPRRRPLSKGSRSQPGSRGLRSSGAPAAGPKAAAKPRAARPRP